MSFYRITPRAGGHRFHIRAELTLTPNQINELYLPVWIAGSYTRRDFSKNLYGLRAEGVPLRLLGPGRWQLDARAGARTVVLDYEFYAHDLSVRQCYLDHQRGLFNPGAACVLIAGHEHEPCHLEISLDADHAGWTVAPAREVVCGDYHELADTPFLLGARLAHFDFDVAGVRHDFYISGDVSTFDLAKLRTDSQRGCQSAFDLFGAFPPTLGPRYCFMLHLLGQGHNGLEHRRSTLLMQRRDAMQTPKAYADLLGLIVHEYFHTWNVKDLKPATYQPYRLDTEQPDELLWLFEGYTAYFDNYLLQRAGLVSVGEYLGLLAADMESLYSRPGRHRQTLVQSSLEAWTKFYAGGENAASVGISYYIQGSLAALCLDLWLRRNSELTLATVLRQLWLNYRATGIGLSEALYREQVAALLPPARRDDFQRLLDRLLHSTEELPLAASLADFGVQMKRFAQHKAYPGFRYKEGRVVLLDENSPAARAGVAMGDRLVAVNGEALPDDEALKAALLTPAPGTAIDLTVDRDGEAFTFHFPLLAPELDKVELTLSDPAASQRWLAV